MLPLVKLCCSGLPSSLIYPRRGRGGRGSPTVEAGPLPWPIARPPSRLLPAMVTPLLGTQLLALVANDSGHEDLVYHTRASRGRVEGGIQGGRGRTGRFRAYITPTKL